MSLWSWLGGWLPRKKPPGPPNPETEKLMATLADVKTRLDAVGAKLTAAVPLVQQVAADHAANQAQIDGIAAAVTPIETAADAIGAAVAPPPAPPAG